MCAAERAHGVQTAIRDARALVSAAESALLEVDTELAAAKELSVALPPWEKPCDVEQLLEDLAAEKPWVRVRDHLSLAEAAWAFGISKPQMRRWFRGTSLPSRNRPWDPPAGAGDPPEPILRFRDRKQWLLVDRLDASRIHPHVAREIEYALMHDEGVLVNSLCERS